MSESLKQNTVRGVIWSSIERLSGQIIGFIVIIVMSRILTQADYGLVGMLMIFIDIADTLVDSGVQQALIRKQDRTEVDCSTAFYFNILLGGVFYVVLFFCAPLIARFYNQPQLVVLTRVISLSVIINSFSMIQRSLFAVKIDFKTQTKASLSAAILSGGLGIALAYTGFGVWSIVVYQLSNLFITCVLLWFFGHWRPRLEFSFTSFKYFFRFGSKLTVAGVMHTIYKDVYLALIGKFYQAATLGLYTRAHQFAALPSHNISNIFQRVTYPVLCTVQDDEERLRTIFLKFLKLTSFLVLPLMTGLAMVAYPLIVLLLGERWEFSATILTILCFAMMWMPMDTLNLSLLQVRGRTDYFLKCEIWKKIIGFGILIGTIKFGIVIICWGQVLRAFIDLIIDSYYTNKFINLGLLSQVKKIFSTILCSGLMAVTIWLIMKLFQENILKLVTGVGVGVVVFFLAAMIFAKEEIAEVKWIISDKILKR